MIFVIDSNICDNLGISPIDYIVIDCATRLSDPLPNKEIAALLQLSPQTTSQSLKLGVNLNLIEQQEDGRYTPTPLWRDKDQIELSHQKPVEGAWEDFIRFYNGMVDKLNMSPDRDPMPHVLPSNKTQMRNFNNIIKLNPKLEMEDIKDVFRYLYAKWKDGEVRDKIRPATVFRSNEQFNKYLGWMQGYKAASKNFKR